MKVLCLSLLCVALYFTSVQADCNVAQKLLVKACVNVFVLANDKAKNPENTTNCRTAQLKEEKCEGADWNTFKACVATDCQMYAGTELADSGMHCTYKQLSDTCGASFASISIITLLVAAFLAMFN